MCCDNELARLKNWCHLLLVNFGEDIDKGLVSRFLWTAVYTCHRWCLIC